jgi:hypothetical protein
MSIMRSLEEIARDVILDDNCVLLKNIENALHDYQHTLDSWKIPCKEISYQNASRP